MMSNDIENLIDAAVLDLEAEGGPRLVGSRCTNCEEVFFPPENICSNCLTENPEPSPLSREGKLYSFSIVHIAPRGWTVPYIIGYVDLPEGPRVFSHIAAPDHSVLYNDMSVKLDVGPIQVGDDGKLVNGFRFVPAA